jgi:hypothetical protein
MPPRLSPILWILVILFPTFGLTSCDKDSEDPLSLHQVENNIINLHYGYTGGVTIIEGDGNYSFSYESPLLKALAWRYQLTTNGLRRSDTKRWFRAKPDRPGQYKTDSNEVTYEK